MAIQIDNYHDPLASLDDLYFVTLTRRSVTSSELSETIDTMQKNWRKITDVARKTRKDFIGVRKLELKVGKGGHGYHPHYHIIIQGKDNAQWLVDQWLLRSSASLRIAQDIRPINNLSTALVELMKYATKLTCADNSNNQILCSAKQMDIIFTALHKRRLFQPFGGLRVRLSEDHFETTAKQIMRAQGLYQWLGHDWYHTEYGQALTNYHPEGEEIQIYRNYHHNNSTPSPQQYKAIAAPPQD